MRLGIASSISSAIVGKVRFPLPGVFGMMPNQCDGLAVVGIGPDGICA